MLKALVRSHEFFGESAGIMGSIALSAATTIVALRMDIGDFGRVVIVVADLGVAWVAIAWGLQKFRDRKSQMLERKVRLELAKAELELKRMEIDEKSRRSGVDSDGGSAVDNADKGLDESSTERRRDGKD